MSDYSAVAPPQNFNKSQAFAAALQRAKQIAAKINPSGAGDGGTKRSLEDGPDSVMVEPDTKKLAGGSGGRRDDGGVRSVPGLPQGGMPGLPGLGLGPVTSEDIKVPDKMVGLIIGRGGEQITRLQSESGCKIQMAPDSGGLPDRVCTLTGNAGSINRAKELINAIVHQRYKTEGPGGPRGGGLEEMMQQQHNNPSFVEVMIPGPKVGLIIGKGGETIKTLQEKSGAKMVVIQDGPNQEAEKPLRITGDPQKVEHAKTLVYELLAEKENQFGVQRRDHGDRGRGGGGGGRGGYSDRGGAGGGPPRGGYTDRRGTEESTYVVPASKCGVVIGRGGETIKLINQQTGAHCELDRRPGNNPNEKVFIIRGNPDQIESAKQMISDKLGGGPGGGGGMGPNANGYGAGPGGPPQYGQNWGAPTGYQQPYHNQMGDPSGGGMTSMNAQSGQPDYSAQWIEYYRSLGMHNEADAIEQQTKAKQAAASVGGGGQGGGGNQGGGGQGGGSQGGQGGGNPPGGGPQPGAQQNGQTPDYSAQWAQYYRSIGKIKEAELIEQQMKNKGGIVNQGGSGGGGGGGGGGPQGFGQAQQGAPGGYYPNPGAPGGFYPGPQQPYQYPGASYQYQPQQQPDAP